MNTEEAADVENGVDDVDDEEDTAPPPKFPFDTVLVAIAFGEDFPSKISNSGLRLHWGFVTGRNGGWLPATPGTVAAIHRHREHVDDQTAQDGGAASQTPVVTGSRRRVARISSCPFRSGSEIDGKRRRRRRTNERMIGERSDGWLTMVRERTSIKCIKCM
jgi:hypothetical protein